MEYKNKKIIENAAEQWVNIIFTHLRYKKQPKAIQKEKNKYGK